MISPYTGIYICTGCGRKITTQGSPAPFDIITNTRCDRAVFFGV